jgi:hypothetical protein
VLLLVPLITSDALTSMDGAIKRSCPVSAAMVEIEDMVHRSEEIAWERIAYCTWIQALRTSTMGVIFYTDLLTCGCRANEICRRDDLIERSRPVKFTNGIENWIAIVFYSEVSSSDMVFLRDELSINFVTSFWLTV